MELFGGLFSDTIGVTSFVTMVVLLAIPVVIGFFIWKEMQAK